MATTYTVTEVPLDHPDPKSDDELSVADFLAGYQIWSGDDWSQALLQWTLSVSRHAPEDSTDYYITRIWKTEGMRLHRTVEVPPTYQPGPPNYRNDDWIDEMMKSSGTIRDTLKDECSMTKAHD